MDIAIIGTGNIGSALASALARTGHRVVVSGRNDDVGVLSGKLHEQDIAGRVTDLATAVTKSDIVILAVPYKSIPEIVGRADFTGRIVVDLSNPVTDDFSGLEIGLDTSAAEQTAHLLSGARVVKAFNTVFAELYAERLQLGGTKVQTFVASDDRTAKWKVIDLASDLGFDARDAGSLKNARYLEPLGYMNIQFGYMLNRGTQIAPAWIGR